MTRPARLLRVAGWGAGIALALVALAASGHGALSPPPLGDPGRWRAWLEQRDPADAAFAILRLAAVGACWYLGATTVIGAALRLLRADVLVGIADRITVAPVRRLLAGSITLALAGLGPTGILAAAAQPAPSATAATSTTWAPSTTSSTSVTTSTSTSTSTSVPGASVTPVTVVMRRLPPPGVPADEPSAATPAAGPADRWTVEPGDCFWTIADDLLQRTWGRSPTDAEIAPYWLLLIEANRSELADPANPSLIFPGQVFTVPTLPPAPGQPTP